MNVIALTTMHIYIICTCKHQREKKKYTCTPACLCEDFYKFGTEIREFWAFLFHPLDWNFQMCREVAKPPELPCVWKMAEEKRMSLERSSEVSYFQLSFSNIEQNFVSHSSFTHLHAPTTDTTSWKSKGSHRVPDFYPPPRKILALCIQPNAPKPKAT